MRIRQVKPAFWEDARMAELPAATRLFYIGLWGIADDAGWLRWDVCEVAALLYRYESRGRREGNVRRMLAQLVTADRVVLRPCGHLNVPHLPEHQHLAGSTKQVQTVYQEHLRKCSIPRIPATTRDDPQLPADARPGKVKVREREGSAPAGATRPNGQRETTDFDRLMAANGIAPGLQPVAALLGSPMPIEASASLSPLEADDG